MIRMIHVTSAISTPFEMYHPDQLGLKGAYFTNQLRLCEIVGVMASPDSHIFGSKEEV